MSIITICEKCHGQIIGLPHLHCESRPPMISVAEGLEMERNSKWCEGTAPTDSNNDSNTELALRLFNTSIKRNVPADVAALFNEAAEAIESLLADNNRLIRERDQEKAKRKIVFAAWTDDRELIQDVIIDLTDLCSCPTITVPAVNEILKKLNQ